MGVIINPRGTSGAGKTQLVRRIMAVYGWGADGEVEPIFQPGRERPICYRLRHPYGGRPLAVLGHYEATSGGCDTVRGLDPVFRLADAYAADGHDVLFEGLVISREVERSVELARAHRLHILRLDTPLEACIRQLIARRRARRATRALISQNTSAQDHDVRNACRSLQDCANVEHLSFEHALWRAQELLGVRQLSQAGCW